MAGPAWLADPICNGDDEPGLPSLADMTRAEYREVCERLHHAHKGEPVEDAGTWQRTLVAVRHERTGHVGVPWDGEQTGRRSPLPADSRTFRGLVARRMERDRKAKAMRGRSHT